MQPRIIPRSDHPISRKNIDPDALKVLYRLYRSGHTAFLVGGGVRDLLIGRHPKDFDICTSARPGQVKKLFRNCWLIGRRFRLAHIHFRDHKIVEVSTFRAQPEREDMGDDDLLVRQDNTFGTPEEDAMRRDFTINGLFYDIASFSLIDYVGGVEDIEAGVIRTIGEPHIRFQEDPVRMIRAIKFAARLDFAIEPRTWDALCDHVEDIRKCSMSRVIEEIARLLEGGACCRSVQLLKASGLLRIVLPELFEYIYGLPAGPGLALEQPIETTESLEEELLLQADEDVDHEAQERMLGIEGGAPEAESHRGRGGRAGARAGHPLEPDPARDEIVEPVAVERHARLPEDEPAAYVDEASAEVLDVDEDGELPTEDDDDIVLSEDEEGVPPDILTPQGTRCVQAPDRGALLWRMLGAVDERVRTGHPMTRPTLFASMFYPVIHHTAEWMTGKPSEEVVVSRGGEARDGENTYMSLLRPLTQTILISRRDRERVCQILAAQRKFRRHNRGFAQVLARKPYFGESLDLYEVSVLGTGLGVDALQWWRTRYPYVAPVVMSTGRARLTADTEDGEAVVGTERWPRRGRRRRGGRGGGESATSAHSQRDSQPPHDMHPRRDARDVSDVREGGRYRRDARSGRGSRPSRDEGRAYGGGQRERGEAPPMRREARESGRGRDARESGRGRDAREGGRAREGREGGRAPRANGRDARETRDSRSRIRVRYMDEGGYRAPRRGRPEEFDYYESRVGHDLTPESPPPRRDDDPRRGRRRRRKPPIINR